MLVVFRTVFVAAVVLLLCAGASQAQDRVIVWSAHPRGSDGILAAPPLQMVKQIDWIEIEAIDVEGAAVNIGQPFKASADWIKNITLKVKNNSAKAITHLQLVLTLPQIKRERQVPYTIDGYGVRPDARIRPGERVELQLIRGGVYDWLKTLAVEQKVDFASIDKAEVLYLLVFFEDGTQFSSGCVKTSDVWHPCPHS